MKTFFLRGLLVFSLLLNAAVAATIGWHLWRKPLSVGQDVCQPLTSARMDQISKLSRENNRAKMIETRRQIQEKRLEILDLIAENPGDITVAETSINEMLALKAKMEREGLTRISRIMADMNEATRKEFLASLKNRACRGPGMRFDEGMRPRFGHGRQAPGKPGPPE